MEELTRLVRLLWALWEGAIENISLIYLPFVASAEGYAPLRVPYPRDQNRSLGVPQIVSMAGDLNNFNPGTNDSDQLDLANT